MTLSPHFKVFQREEKLYRTVRRKASSRPRDQDFKELEIWVSYWDDKEGTRVECIPEDAV